MNVSKELPKFNSEEEESEFWETHSATEFVDESDHVEIDFAPARRANQRRPKGVILCLPFQVNPKAE